MSFQEFEPNESLAEKTYNTVETAADTGKVVVGTNEVTKAIERNNAELVVIAGNVSPQEIVMHIPALASERDADYTFVPDKEELGLAAGINVQSAAIAITQTGNAEDEVEDVASKARELLDSEEDEEEEE
ncbi:ribosomal L7Ae/L30e/S12e/Gadd45 family protein [Candidatus Nanohalobium constans]|uniref:50S ribosomal protein L7Ae n=1 Tax=Candidatus Nanohalobium constans TaxID=2565781 RepID=A0A5Q0UGR8_9ARCH|nr:ribosomal L7Ae/L30e/S12e/Gadd45 family protein [Candidatus Nanohalobium constans]QGA80179.1 50S ribosomal protein L7Ae [Candidatus Nanohalobium constans]